MSLNLFCRRITGYLLLKFNFGNESPHKRCCLCKLSFFPSSPGTSAGGWEGRFPDIKGGLERKHLVCGGLGSGSSGFG